MLPEEGEGTCITLGFYFEEVKSNGLMGGQLTSVYLLQDERQQFTPVVMSLK